MYESRNREAHSRIIVAVEKQQILHICVCRRACACVLVSVPVFMRVGV